MTIIAVSTETPVITCPSWCVVPYAEHVADLPNWEGFVIHHSAGGPAWHSSSTYADGTPDPSEPPLVYIEGDDGRTVDEAEVLARQILAAVEEARA